MTLGRIWREKWQAFSLYRGSHSLPVALFRWCTWALRCLLRLSAVVDIPKYGMRLYLLPHWKGCWKPIFVFREHFFETSDPELEFVRQTLRPGDVFVDAGAYHGWYSLLASMIVGEDGMVLAFEPNSETYEILKRNVALSRCRNVRAFSVALANQTGSASLYRSPGDGSWSALARIDNSVGRESVRTQRLDDIVTRLNLRGVSLMKVDVQGGEAELLLGAADALKRFRPVVIFEVDPAAARAMGVPPHCAWDFLSGLGYRFYRLARGTLVPLAEFPSIPQGKFLNVISIPQERPTSDRLGMAGT